MLAVVRQSLFALASFFNDHGDHNESLLRGPLEGNLGNQFKNHPPGRLAQIWRESGENLWGSGDLRESGQNLAGI